MPGSIQLRRGVLGSCTAFAAMICTVAAGNVSRFRYHEDFEGSDPVREWASDGAYTIHFKGITEEKAFSGKRSFKLDVTLDSGSYHYWRVPVTAPCEGELKLSARVLVAGLTGGRVGIGPNFLFPPTGHSGGGPVTRIGEPTENWQLLQSDLVAEGRKRAVAVISRHVSGATDKHAGVLLDRWGLFIYGKPGDRVVVYVDDVRIAGRTPDPVAYGKEAQRRWRPVQEAFAKRVAAWQRELRTSLEKIGEPASVSPAANRLRDAAVEAARRAELQLRDFRRAGSASPSAVAELEQQIARVRTTVPNILKLASDGREDVSFVTYVTRAITNYRILPETFPLAGPISRELRVTACRGEYEPATFAVSAFRDIEGLRVTVSDLKAERGTAAIGADAVDVRIVKCWFQAGVEIWETGQRVLTPELLLKDDGLVRVDLATRQNELRTSGPGENARYISISDPDGIGVDVAPRDTATLQPLDIPNGMTRQFWITIHVPPDARPGRYRGRIVLNSHNDKPASLVLKLRVLPFELRPPLLDYAIYYRAYLTEEGHPHIGSEAKSMQQDEAELRNMKAHGVVYPTVYQHYDPVLLRDVFRVRRRLGLPRDALYSVGLVTGNPTGLKELGLLRSRVRNWVAEGARHGYGAVYLYGMDEARDERLVSQRKAWRVVHEEGAGIFAACYKGAAAAMGDAMDVAVMYGPPDPEEASAFHALGKRVFCYSNPQVGIEEPLTYRRNFGLLLWKAGYDGAMDYAYQHAFNHAWNDFDHERYRDHIFAYPTVDGVIDTIQWEGFREGVDDVRYLATLLHAIRNARPEQAAIARSARQWVGALDPAGSPGVLRARMIDRLLRLQPPR